MTPGQRQAVKDAAENGLNEAVSNWKKVGHLMRVMVLDHVGNEAYAKSESYIPGHPFIETGKPAVDEFIALAVDMRKSSARLITNEHFPGIESGIQRVYYETSALLPALAQTARFEDGEVTEFLGDGVLILFKVDEIFRTKSVTRAHLAAKNCIAETRDIVNALLHARFSLPEIQIGAGLSISKALVTLVGLQDNMQPKAIGQCVWEASKLSDGVNRVHMSKSFRAAWPTSKGGTTTFTRLPPSKKHDVEGYRIEKT